MKDNKNILNEAFFKKATYAENKAKRLPQYTPVELKASGSEKKLDSFVDAFSVTNTDEVKKRLAGAYGVTFGNNNIKNMAARSLKTFPIIISDNVEPETAVMLKKLMEEQYAEYINLLISNQVVNLADYSTGDENGNIAIQALDTISGPDFSKNRVANKAARTGSVTTDDLFQNIPLYNLLRENQQVLSVDDTIIDNLLENALIVDDEGSVKKLVNYIYENQDEITNLLEADPDPRETDNDPSSRDDNKEKPGDYSDPTARAKNVKLRRYLLTKVDDKHDLFADDVLKIDSSLDAKRGFAGLDSSGKEIYRKLTTADIVLDKDRFDQAINRSVGQMLSMPENIEIRDKFEKATMLLQSRKIAGVEYYNYLTIRLGIPVSDAARQELVRNFKFSDIRDFGKNKFKVVNGVVYNETNPDDNAYLLTDNDLKLIAQNRTNTSSVLSKICRLKISDFMTTGSWVKAGGVGLGVGAAAGAAVAGGGALATGALGAAGIIGMLAMPFMAPIIAGAAVVGSGAYILHKYAQARAKRRLNLSKVEGWERVEALINQMEEHQQAIRNGFKTNAIKDKDFYKTELGRDVSDATKFVDKAEIESRKDYEYALNNVENARDNYLQAQKIVNNELSGLYAAKAYEYETKHDKSTFSALRPMFTEMFVNQNVNDENYSALIETCQVCSKDSDLCNEVLTEKVLSNTTMPVTVKYVEKKNNKDVLVTPDFMVRDTYAYGSTEIERKENKDRKYNQPLIMTVKFKERFSDGKYSDNELTAVIGILGKIIRVPSEEMEYILSANLKGDTLEGFFKGDIKNSISDMLSGSRIAKELKNLPQSADIWHNLEKVATLAAANKISGNRNNNIANAHIIFSQREIDAIRNETGVDYLRDTKKAVALMKRYSAFTLMVANDPGQRVAILDDQDNISWNIVPYSALTGKDSGDQLNAALTKMMRL